MSVVGFHTCDSARLVMTSGMTKAMRCSVAVGRVPSLALERMGMIWRDSGDGRLSRLRFGGHLPHAHSGSHFDEVAKAIGGGHRTLSVGVDGMGKGSVSGSDNEMVWEGAICFVDCCSGGGRAIAAGVEKVSGMNRKRTSRIAFYDGSGHCYSGDSSDGLICRRDGAGFCDDPGRRYRRLSCCCGGCDGVYVSFVPSPLTLALLARLPSVRAAASPDHSSRPHRQPVPVF